MSFWSHKAIALQLQKKHIFKKNILKKYAIFKWEIIICHINHIMYYLNGKGAFD